MCFLIMITSLLCLWYSVCSVVVALVMSFIIISYPGLLSSEPQHPRRRSSTTNTHHHSRVFHHHNTKFSYSESDEDEHVNETKHGDDSRRMQISDGAFKSKERGRKKIRLDIQADSAKENFLGTRKSSTRVSKETEDVDQRSAEDTNNNNSSSDDRVVQETMMLDVVDKCDEDQQTALKESMTAAIENLIGTWPTTLPCLPGNEDAIPSVTLEALHNTKAAMTQFAANALNAVNNQSSDKPPTTPLQDLALLQSTLITLQQQQLLQLQLINQLQQQIEETDGDENKKRPKVSAKKEEKQTPQKIKEDANTAPQQQEKKSSMTSLSPHFASLLNCGNQDPNRPLSPGLPPPHMLMMGLHADNAQGGATGNSRHQEQGDRGKMNDCDDPMMMMSNMLLPPPPVNTLEVLQKRAQEVLDSASQGLLASSLAADDPRRKGVGYDKSREPFFKHRCRYCGKVFGSDSALQIHIRSHTGERPFKCNVCGSRFTTKGNLKVHFQRHAQKFPHIKMNPHPVPEQFDHLHPPLLAAGQTSPPDLSPNFDSRQAPPPFHVPAFLPHHPFHSITGGPPPPPPPPPPQHQNNKHESSSRADMISKYENPLGFGKERINTPQDLTKREPDEKSSNKAETLRARTHVETRTVITRFAERSSSFLQQQEKQELSDDVAAAASSEQDPVVQQLAHNASNQQELVRCMMMMMRDKPNKVTNVSPFLTGDDEQRNTGSNAPPNNLEDAQDEEEDDDDLYDQPQNLSNNNINDDEPLDTTTENDDENEMDQHNLNRYNRERETRGGSIGKQPTISHAHPPDRPHSASTFLRSQSQDLRLLLPSSATSSPTTSYESEQKHSPDTQNPSDITKDPAIYTNLLPRPGSNDNAWESLIEVTKTSETSKLQQLVDNIEHKLTDPNQCIICHRVLSCKSALQMHYRTHTGERPFKCKICGRAFTTKGNLKTHMGVHRAKPPLRVLHQCPVCHKRFTNSLVLQQHIRLHTGEPTDLTPDQIRAAEVKDHYLLTPSSTSSTPSPHSFPPFPSSSTTPPSSTPLPPQLFGSPNQTPQFFAAAAAAAAHAAHQKEEMEIESDTELSDTDTKSISSNPQVLQPQSLPFSTSLAALENQVKTITTLANSQNMMMMMMADKQRHPQDLTKPHRFEESENEDSEEETWKVKNETPDSPENELESKASALDLTGNSSSKADSPRPPSTPPPQQPMHSFHHPGLLLPPGAAPPPHPFALGFTSPLLIPPPPPPPPGSAAAAVAVAMAERARLGDSNCFLWSATSPGSLARGNTTCSICLKTFACHSALEIHYRSHTKERPFKCTVCDRGFSTKGNMKQHMLTHKIRDMPSSSSSSSSAGSNTQTRSNLDTTSPPAHNHNSVDSGSIIIKSSDDDSSRDDNNSQSPFRRNNDEEDEENQKKQESDDDATPPRDSPRDPSPPPPHHNTRSTTQHARASPSTSSTPPPREPHHHSQPPVHSHVHAPSPSTSSTDSSSKHVCKVCTKNFSSTSALQIHMRTHTGDRPFVCSVCQKAFTTKGNLKVHMGTHMWTNGASRRGRRMSLDMPLGLAAAVAAAAQGNPPHHPHPHHPFFHHPGFPPPPPPQSLLKEKDPSLPRLQSQSSPLQALSLYHHVQTHPYGPSHNQTSPPSSSPLLFLNGSLQKDLARSSSISPSQQPQHQGSSSNTSDRKDDSLADRNNASCPEQESPEESPKERYSESSTSGHKKLEMMIKQEQPKAPDDKTQFLQNEDERECSPTNHT